MFTSAVTIQISQLFNRLILGVLPFEDTVREEITTYLQTKVSEEVENVKAAAFEDDDKSSFDKKL